MDFHLQHSMSKSRHAILTALQTLNGFALTLDPGVTESEVLCGGGQVQYS